METNNSAFSFKRLFSNERFIAAVYLVVVAVAVFIKYRLGSINNFIIYRNSFFHLIHHQTLYGFFPSEQYDEFLYGPAFAVFIAPFALLPVGIGVIVWELFNAFAVFLCVKWLNISQEKKVFIWWFVLIELLTSVQNVQINPLIGALLVFTFSAFENKKTGLAAFFVVLGTFLKVFGILGASMFLLYPGKLKFILYGILWSALLLLCPLIFVAPAELIILYESWFKTLVGDHAVNHDLSVMRLFIVLFKPVDYGYYISVIQLLAIMLFCVKYVRYKQFQYKYFRQLFLASLMIWCVIYSHAAESSTYIIAVLGVGIWYVAERKSTWTLALLIFVFVFTSLSPTDLFPEAVRVNFFLPYAIKAMPCFLVWLLVEYRLLFYKTD